MSLANFRVYHTMPSMVKFLAMLGETVTSSELIINPIIDNFVNCQEKTLGKRRKVYQAMYAPYPIFFEIFSLPSSTFLEKQFFRNKEY